MVSFWIYDVSFLVIFTLGVTWFLHSRKKDISREGIIFMYRTQLGVKLIKKVGDRFQKALGFLKYVVIAIGTILMAIMVWMLGQTVSIYVLHPEITKLIKAPPVAPLIPYFPKLFGMESFFPPFYFTYFIVALAIVAIFHEFSHGVFMRRFGIKIKSTGLVFLGPILGAFVEEDRNNFEKKKNSEQMAVLGAGVFANILLALLFYLLYLLFFTTFFAPSGYLFDTYAFTQINSSNITGFEEQGNLVKIYTSNETYYLDENLKIQLNSSSDLIIAYTDSPAVQSQINGAIVQINNVKITGQDKLREYLENKNPGDKVNLVAEDSSGTHNYEIILGKNPQDKNLSYLGVGNLVSSPKGIVQKTLKKLMFFKNPTTYYKPIIEGESIDFFSNLLWWVMIINLLVALFNMLPLGMLDGGRFFYLLILSLTSSKKAAQSISKIMKYLILLSFVALMFFWFLGIV